MPVASWVKDLIGGGASKIIDSVTDGAKKFITTEKDRQEFELLVMQSKFEVRKLELEAENRRLEDVQGARDLYKHDASLQKVYAITFLVGYLAMTIAMIYIVVGWIGAQRIEIPEWAIALITTIYTAMSTKVGTITDFFFGSSQGSKDKDDIARAVAHIPTKTQQ